MKKLKIEKKILPFDESTFCGELAYGYGTKLAAKKAIEEHTGESVDIENLQKLRVTKVVGADGNDIYFWGDICPHCGAKNNGIWSYADFH